MLIIKTPLHRKFLNFYLNFFSLNYQKVFIRKGSVLSANLTIGTGTCINGPVLIKGSGNVEIGNYCAFGGVIDIISSNHDMNYPNLQYKLQKEITGMAKISAKKDVSIGHNVWIGDHVIILPGVKIGNGAVLAAGSVITKDAEPFGIYGGNPAVFIRKRFSEETIQKMQILKWWDWSKDEMKNNKQFFETRLDA